MVMIAIPPAPPKKRSHHKKKAPNPIVVPEKAAPLDEEIIEAHEVLLPEAARDLPDPDPSELVDVPILVDIPTGEEVVAASETPVRETPAPGAPDPGRPPVQEGHDPAEAFFANARAGNTSAPGSAIAEYIAPNGSTGVDAPDSNTLASRMGATLWLREESFDWSRNEIGHRHRYTLYFYGQRSLIDLFQVPITNPDLLQMAQKRAAVEAYNKQHPRERIGYLCLEVDDEPLDIEIAMVKKGQIIPFRRKMRPNNVDKLGL